ncbi:MAG: hypothetical protein IAB75_03030 [Bacteroidetes bacterium]|uniref:DUF1735 domain-containing protein n=1 Tax=Candidatus Cryptobacteroides avicola TaxID=2840757 RepID=A0A940DRR6_9BACT|nr:hypothetical protein [Candidatus Cryptobacteroides avicola]
MKKSFFMLGISALVAGTMFTACKENPSGPETVIPTVSISADASFASDNTATLTLSLSEATTEDVSVTLADADVQSGSKKVSAIYSKNVTIAAGETSATVDVQADILGLEEGTYQAAIQIASAEGAEVAENPVVYIALNYVQQASVDLYADNTTFRPDGTAALRLVLSEASSMDVTVTLEEGEGTTADVSYEKTVTIPAGETEKEVILTVEIPENLEPGTYPAVIQIASVENALAGNAKSATINLVYPFTANITVDGVFDDWDTAPASVWTLPEGDVKYGMIKTLKLAANGSRVFVYFEFDDPSNYNSKTPYEDNSLPFNMYIDTDGDPTTGAIVTAVDNDTYYPPYDADHMGLEYYLEITLHDVGTNTISDFWTYGGLYRYDGDDGDAVFSKLTQLKAGSDYDGSSIYGSGVYENGTGRVEVQLSRQFFEMTGSKARFAVKVMDQYNNWKALGLLPQGNSVEVDGVTQHGQVDMAEITLPDYEG